MARDDDGWVPVRDASERLGLNAGYVAAGRVTGRFPVVRRSGADWMRVEDLEALCQERDNERSTYVSYEAAARMAGCSHVVIEAAVAQGEIEQRAGERHRGQPSLRIESAQSWAEGWIARQATRAAEQESRRADAEERQRLMLPPDNEHVWLDVTTAALAVGITAGGLRNMAGADRVPHQRVGRRLWFRRDLLETWIAARAVASRFRTGVK